MPWLFSGWGEAIFRIFALLKQKWQQWCISGVAVLPVGDEVVFHLQVPQEAMPVNAGSGTAL